MESTLDTLGENAVDLRGQSPKRYMNVSECAKLIGVSRWTLNSYCAKGIIPFTPLGPRTKRFDRRLVEEAMLKRTVKARF